MRITRVYTDANLVVGTQTELNDASTEKLTRVLRLRRGDPVVLFNGDGFDYSGTLEPLGKGHLGVSLTDRVAATSESPLRLTLLQSVARGEKMDWVLQKATELGVAAIQPVTSKRTEVKLDADRTARRMRHWLSVIHAACEQCGRAVVPSLAVPLPLSALPEADLPGLRLSLHPGGPPMRTLARISHSAAMTNGVAIAVGPEGGFSDTDLKILEQIGFLQVGLGPRILRTETAGAAALATLQALFGDLG